MRRRFLWGSALVTLAGCGTVPVTPDRATPPAVTAPSPAAIPAGREAPIPTDGVIPAGAVQPAPAGPQPKGGTGLPPSGRNTDDQKPPLQPGVGNVFLPPPAIPPLPEGMKAWDKAEGAIKDRPPAPLEEFEKLACEHNPTLVQARAQAEGAFGQAVQAGLWPNPRFFYIQDQINQKGTPGEFQGAAVQQEIVTADKRKLSRAKFLEQTKAAEWQALAQEYMVLNDVRAHYFRTLGKQELVRVGYELLKNMEDRLVTLREMYNLGQATRDELHTANANLQDARLALLDLQNDYLQAWETLTALAGVDMPPRPLAGGLEEGLPPIEWDAALARLLAESPEVRRTEAHLRADVIGLKREKVESIPNVFVRAGSGYNFPDQRPVGTVTVFFDVPVIDWNQGNVRTARSHVDRQAAEVRRVELDLRRRLAAVYRVYLSALQHVKEYRETVLPEARKAYEVMLDQYKADRVKWVDVLAVEQAYFARRATYIANLVAWRESEVLIVGYLLAGGLTPAAAPLPVPAAGPAGGSAGPGLIGNPPGLPGDQGNQGGAVGGGQGPMRRNQR